MQLGLLEFVEKRLAGGDDKRLFADIEPGANGEYSHYFSKWFTRYPLAHSNCLICAKSYLLRKDGPKFGLANFAEIAGRD